MQEWLDDLEKNNSQQYFNISSKIDNLEQHGFKLLGTTMFDPIRGHTDLYELRGSQARILVYFDSRNNAFILLHGFLKKKQRERHEIAQGMRYLDEYLDN